MRGCRARDGWWMLISTAARSIRFLTHCWLSDVVISAFLWQKRCRCVIVLLVQQVVCPKAEEFSAFFHLLWCNKPNVFTAAGPFNDCNLTNYTKALCIHTKHYGCSCLNFVGKIPGVWRCNKIKFVWLQSGQQILWSVHYYSVLRVCSTLFCALKLAVDLM